MGAIVPIVAATIMVLSLVSCSGSPQPDPAPTKPPLSTASLLPLSPEVASSQVGFFMEMTPSEQACTQKVGETLGQRTLRQYSIDLYECVGDETLLRWLTHPFGFDSFALESSACIREGAGPMDLRRMMLVGPPLSAESLVFGIYVQWCMTEAEYTAYVGKGPDRSVLDCVFMDGVEPPLERVREHEGTDDGDMVEAYNNEIDKCIQ